jgi:hypothetical protein
MRNTKLPLEPALPVDAMFHEPDRGGLFAPSALDAPKARPRIEATTARNA